MATETVRAHANTDASPTPTATGNVSTLPERFEVTMPDEALGAQTPKGTRLVFRRAAAEEQPEEGDGVLVRDGAGELHVRKCERAQPGSAWTAAARSPAFKSFNMQRDACRLVGMLEWRGCHTQW